MDELVTTPASASPAADALREEANALFGQGRVTQALALYSAAIEAAPSAALFGNRAACHLKLESYGSAIADADAAQRLDGAYVKARYRRGSALMALGRVADAKKEFAEVVRVRPADPDAKAKLAECVKALRLKAFADAIEVEHTRPLWETLDASAIAVPPEYLGLRLPALPEAETAASAAPASANFPSSSSSSSGVSSLTDEEGGGGQGGSGPEVDALMADASLVGRHGVSLAFVQALMAGFKAGTADKTLHKRFVLELLLRLRRVLASCRSLVHAPWPAGAPHYNVCGDTHGQYYDTLNIFELAGTPSPRNPYVFNGDFVDRGSFSVENVLALFAWKLLLPDHVHLTRGNHETRNMNKMYGFEGEVKHKYDQATMDLFFEVFQALPLAVCIDRRVLVLHGGLFQRDGVTLDEIARIDRFREPPEGGGLMSDLMWSDPQPFMGRGPSKRGVGQSFGPDVTARFLADNALEYLIRSHEVKDEGYVVEHAGKCVTVFSAPNYCDTMNNLGAVCRVQAAAGLPPQFITFKAVPHPPVKPMAYAGPLGGMFGL